MTSDFKPTVRGGVIFNTSLGPLSLHLYGHDLPEVTQSLVDLCTAGFYNGALVHTIIRDNFVEVRNMKFPLGVDPLTRGEVLGAKEGGVRPAYHLVSGPGPVAPAHVGEAATKTGRVKPNQVAAYATAGRRPPGTQSRVLIDRPGLVFLKVADHGTALARCTSQLLITTTSKDLSSALGSSGEYCLIGEAALNKEGKEVLRKLNAALLKPMPGVDRDTAMLAGPPLRLIRVHQTLMLEGITPRTLSTPALTTQELSAVYVTLPKIATGSISLLPAGVPEYTTTGGPQQSASNGVVLYNPNFIPDGFLSSDGDDDEKDHPEGEAGEEKSMSELEELRDKVAQERVNHTRKLMLQVMNEIPDANLKPPENVLFVCKLNPLTISEELAICFKKFGKVTSCDILKDRKTGQSLRYGFIEFETKVQAERAYLKMDEVLIDDSRIHVDFCQSVSNVWAQHRQRKQDQQPNKRTRDDE